MAGRFKKVCPIKKGGLCPSCYDILGSHDLYSRAEVNLFSTIEGRRKPEMDQQVGLFIKEKKWEGKEKRKGKDIIIGGKVRLSKSEILLQEGKSLKEFFWKKEGFLGKNPKKNLPPHKKKKTKNQKKKKKKKKQKNLHRGGKEKNNNNLLLGKGKNDRKRGKRNYQEAYRKEGAPNRKGRRLLLLRGGRLPIRCSHFMFVTKDSCQHGGQKGKRERRLNDEKRKKGGRKHIASMLYEKEKEALPYYLIKGKRKTGQ